MKSRKDLNVLIKQIKNNLHTSYWFTPSNLIVEKTKFFNEENYNPKFLYPKLPINNLNKFLKKLKEIKINFKKSTEDVILKRKIEEIILKIKLILSRGTQEMTEISSRLYECNFDKNTINNAKNDSRLKVTFEKQEDLDSYETIKKMKEYLEEYNITNWDVKISDKVDFYFRILTQEKTILVGKNINWDFCDLDNSLAHEIDCHVIRTINAQKQKNPIFRKPLPFYIKTEEGLASYLGDYHSSTNEISRKHHALKYLAGKLALKNSFSEVYKFLVKNGFTKDLAFQRTFRLKRGFEDTSTHGCFAKEAMYYEGMMEVKKFFDKGGDVRKIFAGKIGLKDIEYTPIPKGEIIPKRLIDFLQKSK